MIDADFYVEYGPRVELIVRKMPGIGTGKLAVRLGLAPRQRSNLEELLASMCRAGLLESRPGWDSLTTWYVTV